jgi:hypothetical protein
MGYVNHRCMKLSVHLFVYLGMGNSVETVLSNKSGDEESSYAQTISFG